MKLSKRLAQVKLEVRKGSLVICQPTAKRMLKPYGGWAPTIHQIIKDKSIMRVTEVNGPNCDVEGNAHYWPIEDLIVVG